MAQNQKSYDNEFKAQAVKLAQEIGGHKDVYKRQTIPRSISVPRYFETTEFSCPVFNAMSFIREAPCAIAVIMAL